MIGITGYFYAVIKLIEHYLVKPFSEKCSHSNIFLNLKFPHAEKKYVLFTFDVEEDWISGMYLGGYRSLTPTILMAKSLAEVGVKGTFFVTPQVARDNPDIVLELSELKHEIGVHLHPHNLLNIKYPYEENRSLRLNRLKQDLLKDFIMKAKEKVESNLDIKIKIFRSGNLSSNPQVELACLKAGFQIISNYSFNSMLPTGIFNVDSGIYDICFEGNTISGLIKLSKAVFKFSNVLVLSGHPMLLYNPLKKKILEKPIHTIFHIAQDILSNNNVESVTMTEFVQPYYK